MAALFGLLVSLLLGLVVHRGDFFMHSTLRLIAGNIDNALNWLSALAVNSVIAPAAIVVGGATAFCGREYTVRPRG